MPAYAEDRKIVPTSIEDEMKSSFMDYAMSVIVARALPDVRDGLKPVHRRILYAMHGLNLTPGRPQTKSARVAGETSGKFHPHGEQVIYPSLVRMAQDFSLRYMLVDGQGNFGSIDGDPPAQMRYTEVRMTPLGLDMLEDIEKETVDMMRNYLDDAWEPTVLPSAAPNLLINGSQGIAVGMATNIPPHNMGETIDGLFKIIDQPDISLEDLMEVIKGPDFPTGGIIMGREGIRQAYSTGRGKLTVRARASIEKAQTGGKEAIIVTEIPYMVNKGDLLETIANLVRDKRVEGISDIRDESDRDGMRIVIELKRGEVPEVTLNQLYSHSNLQTTFGVILLALVGQRPKVLTLRDMLWEFLQHRVVIVQRRAEFDLRKARDREHVLEGLVIALDNIDEVVKLIRASSTPKEAQDSLMDRFGLSEVQAKAILEMRLQRLTGLEREKVEGELRELKKEIARLEKLLSGRDNLLAKVKEELTAVREKYADDRRTEIVEDEGEFAVEDFIADEDMAITISHTGYIKRLPVTTYRKQHRGGRGVSGMETREEDFVENLFIASNHQHILFFTDRGQMYWLKVHRIPRAGRLSKGRAVVNILNLKDEAITAFLPVREFREDQFVLMATERGIVKKTGLSAFSNPRQTGIRAIVLDEGDRLIAARLTDGDDTILLATQKGMSIRFSEKDVRPMGRTTRGVIGIALEKDDRVIGVETAPGEDMVLAVTENGYGKRSHISEYRLQKRGGKGIINIKTSERNGEVVGMTVVKESEDIVLITQEGMVIRSAVSDSRVIGRNTQGVRVINLKPGDKVVSLALFAEKDSEASLPANDQAQEEEAEPAK